MWEKMKKRNGFTLPEIVVTLLLLALLFALAVPSLQQCWQQVVLDVAIQQLHRDLRWAQQMAVREQKRVTVLFFLNEKPYYVVRYAGVENLRRRELPDRLQKIEAETIVIATDRTLGKNGHILLQKGEIKRYVYYYRTGRTRVSKQAI